MVLAWNQHERQYGLVWFGQRCSSGDCMLLEHRGQSALEEYKQSTEMHAGE